MLPTYQTRKARLWASRGAVVIDELRPWTCRFFDPVVRRVEEIIGEITCVAPHNDEDPMKCSRHQAPREDSVSAPRTRTLHADDARCAVALRVLVHEN